MALPVGARRGPYEIAVQIGVGGMGEVYRATDINLGRQVAIKVLPDAFASDAERLARFDREGPTLADRIALGPIPGDEALAIAKQIAEALDAAHERGIVHRDLKPANVKITPERTVKLLDFGLAKSASDRSAVSLSHSPTVTVAGTLEPIVFPLSNPTSKSEATPSDLRHRAVGTNRMERWQMIELTRILTPVDFSDDSQHALAYAIAMARSYDARVTALHVFFNRPAVNIIPSIYPVPMAPVRFESIRNELTAHTQTFVEAVQTHEVPIDVVVEEAPDVHREILAQAEVRKVDLIVMGIHGRGGLERLMLGSTTEKVLRKAMMCPVMVVPPRAPDTPASEPVQFRRILCPVDFSEGSLAALKYAMSLAREADAQLTLLHAVERPPELYEAPMTSGSNVETMRDAAEADRLRRLEALVPEEVREFCTVHTSVVEARCLASFGVSGSESSWRRSRSFARDCSPQTEGTDPGAAGGDCSEPSGPRGRTSRRAEPCPGSGSLSRSRPLPGVNDELAREIPECLRR